MKNKKPYEIERIAKNRLKQLEKQLHAVKKTNDWRKKDELRRAISICKSQLKSLPGTHKTKAIHSPKVGHVSRWARSTDNQARTTIVNTTELQNHRAREKFKKICQAYQRA